jgi:hypothetical protein
MKQDAEFVISQKEPGHKGTHYDQECSQLSFPKSRGSQVILSDSSLHKGRQSTQVLRRSINFDLHNMFISPSSRIKKTMIASFYDFL